MNWWLPPIAGFVGLALNEIANPRRSFLGDIFWRGDRRGIALTFDDGPHPQHSLRLLEILDDFQAQATFFVIGRHVKEHGDLVARAARAGHGIGNHTYHHHRGMNFSSMEKICKEVVDCQAEIEKWVGYRPRFYRQPAGFRNPNIFRILKRLGMAMVGWQVRAYDTQRRDPETIARRILRKAEPGGVLLLHDGSDSIRNADRRATLEAMPKILKGLKDRGLEFLSLEELLGMSKEVEPICRE